MTKAKKFKNRVRARAEKTGESYQAARRHFGRFEGIVLETIRLAQPILDEHNSRDTFHTLAEAAAKLAEGRWESPAERKLREFIQSLPDEDVFVLQAMMYAGRDREDPRDVYGDLSRGSRNREASELSVLSKLPLPDYLRRGLNIAKSSGVNLDAAWEKRGSP